MDIYCPKKNCGEPVEMDYLHDVADEKNTTYEVILHEFQSNGCMSLGWNHSDNGDRGGERAMMMEAMFDLLGDDVDGAAAMMEDAGFF